MKLKRFPDEKQDQINQLVEYAQLLGLSGRDLVAIGGKIDREQTKQRKLANMEIVQGFECLPVGKDSLDDINHRFRLKTVDGSYRFIHDYGYQWSVFSLKTRVTSNAFCIHI